MHIFIEPEGLTRAMQDEGMAEALQLAADEAAGHKDADEVAQLVAFIGFAMLVVAGVVWMIP